MLIQFLNLVFLKAFAFQFINYALLTVAFFSFFVLVNNIMEAQKAKNLDNNLINNNF